MGRNQFAHAKGDAANAILGAIGYSFRRILAWIKLLLTIQWADLKVQTRENPTWQIC